MLKVLYLLIHITDLWPLLSSCASVPVHLSSTLLIDNQSAIQVAKNPDHHGRMKHLDLRYYWLRDEVEDGFISPVYVPTGENAADLLTKPLELVKTELFRSKFGLH